MKLHLPTRLRSALIACITAVAALSPTLATGCIGGGVIALALANQAVANPTLSYDDATKTITLSGNDNTDITDTNVLSAGGDNTSDYTLKLQMTDSSADHNYFGSNGTYNMNLLIDGGNSPDAQGFIINNGNSGTFCTFTGNVTGNGVMMRRGNGRNTGYMFTGNVSQYTGNISLKANAGGSVCFTLVFGNGGTATCDADHGVSGTGSITFNAAGDRNGDYNFGGTNTGTGDLLAYNYNDTNPVYVTNEIKKGSDSAISRVTQSGNASITYTKACTIDLLTLKAGSATFNNTLTGGNIIVANGASLTLTSDSSISGALTLNGATTINAGTLTLGSDSITMGANSSLTLNEGAVLDITNIATSGQDALSEGDNGFKVGVIFLQAEEGATITGLTQVKKGEETVNVLSNSIGQYYIAAEGDGIFYVNGTYTYDSSSDSAITKITTHAGANLTLNAGPSGTVTVSGNTDMTIGTDMTLNDKVTISSGTLNLTVNNGATVVQSSSGKDGKNSYVNGSINITGNGTYSLKVGDAFGWGAGYTICPAINIENGTLALNGTTQTLGTPLNLNGNAYVTGDGASDEAGIGVFSNDNANTGSGLLITARNTGNDISAQIRLRHDLTVNVDGADSNLTISGKVKNGSFSGQNTHKATMKTGEGTLTFTHADNAFVGGFSNNAGTTIVTGSSTFGGELSEGYKALSIAAGSTMQLNAATTANGDVIVNGNLALGDNASFALGSSGMTVGATGSLALGTNAVLDVTNVMSSGQDMLSEGVNGFKFGKLFLQAAQGSTVSGLTQVKNGEAMLAVHNENGQYYVETENDGIFYVNGTYTYDGTNTEITNITTHAGANLTLNASPSGTVTIDGDTELTIGTDMTLNTKVVPVSGAQNLAVNLTVNNGATVVQNSVTNNVYGYVNGTITVTDGATYRIVGGDALGWGSSGSTAALNIDNSTVELTDRVTLVTPILMSGNAIIQDASEGLGTGEDAPMLDMFGATITATGINNTISTTLSTRNDATIQVTNAGDELLYSGRVYARGSFKGNVTKTGEGTLTFSYNGNNFAGAYANNAGTTLVKGTTTYNGALSIAAGSTMQLNAAVTANGAVAVNGDLTLGDNGSLTLGATASLEINKTIAGAGSSALALGSGTTLSVTSIAILDSAASDGNQNGFADSVVYTLAKGVTVTGYDGKKVTVNGTETDLAFADGNLTFTLAGGTTYWVRTGVVTFANDGDMAKATAFQITSDGTLTLEGNTVPGEGVAITNAGTVNLKGNTSGLAKVANNAQGTVYLTDTNGGQALAFTGAFGAAAAPVFTVNDSTKRITVTTTENTFTGNIVVKNGYTLESPASGSGLGANYVANTSRAIIVENGATYFIGSSDAHPYYKFILQEGATMSSVAADMKIGQMQIPVIELEGNATVTVNAGHNMRMVGSGWSPTTLALGTHTLTKADNGAFVITNTNVTGTGTLDIQGGSVTLHSYGAGQDHKGTVAEATINTGDNGTLIIDGDNSNTSSVFRLTGTGTLQITNGKSLALGNDTTASVSHANTIRIGTEAGHASTITLGSQATLTAPTTVENGTLSLAGSGTYDLGNSLAMTDKVALADAWSGTVAVANAVVNANTDTSSLTNNFSTLSINGLTVEGTSTALTLAANTVLDGTLKTANTITLVGALTLGDNFVLDLSALAPAAGAENGETIYTVFTGGGINLSSILRKDQITGLGDDVDMDALTINSDGTISYITSVPDNVLPVEGNIVYDDTAASNDEYTTIRLSEGGSLAFTSGAKLNSHVTALEVRGSGSVLSNGTEDSISFETVNVAAGKTLTLAAGSTNLTTAVTQSLAFGEGSSIAVEQGQVLDVTALDFDPAFRSVAAHVSGDGTVNFAGQETISDTNRLLLRNATSDVSTDVNIHVTKNMAINGWGNASNASVLLGKALTVDSTLRLETNVTVNVNENGSLQAKIIELGHGDGGANPGHLVLANDGSIKAGSIVSTASGGTGNSLSMTGGTLELTTERTTINGGTGAGQIATTVTGGVLKAETASWGISGATVGGVAITTDMANNKAITLTDTTLTASLNTDAGKLVLAGAQTIQGGESFNTSEEGTSFFSIDNAAQNNGYKTTNRIYTIASNGDNLDVASVTGWSIATTTREATPETVEYTGDGKVTAYGVKGTDYYVNTTVTYDASNEFDNASKLVIASQDGTAGSLILASNLAGDLATPAPDGGILVEASGASLTIDNGVTLDKSQLAIGTGGSVSIKGSGMLTMSGNQVLQNGLGGITMDATGWTGTVRLIDSVGISAQKNNLTLLQNLGGAGGKVQLYNVAGYVDSSSVISTNLELLGSADGSTATGADALTLNDGSSNGTPEFSGAITGNGNFNVAWSANNIYTAQFSGDVSGWTGKCKVTSSTGTRIIVFKGNAKTINAHVEGNSNTTVKFDNANNTVAMNGTVAANRLEATANTTLNLANTVTVNTLAGAADSNIAATGALHLKSGASTAAALSATGGLTLGVAAQDDGTAATHATLAATGALTLGDSLTLNGLNSFMEASPTGAMITANSLTLGSGLSTFNINADLAGLESGDSLTLLSLTQAADASIGVTLQGESGMEYTTDRYVYTLAWNDDRTQLTLSVKAAGTDWVGAGTGDPAMADWSGADNWSSGVVPGDTDTALLGGTGAPVINVDAPEGGSISVGNVTVDNTDAQGVDTPVENYTFTGGALTAEGQLQILHGGLTIDNATSFGGVEAGADADKIGGIIESDGKLAVGDGNAENGSGALTVGADNAPANLTNKGELVVNTDGALEVSGNLDSSAAGSMVTLNGGTATVGGTLSLSQESLDNASNLAAGSLNAADTALTNRNSLTLGTVDGTDSTLKSITLEMGEQGQYQNASLTIIGSGSSLTLTEDSVLGTLHNEGTINAGGNTLFLTQATQEGGTLQAGLLLLHENAAGSALTALTTDSIHFQGLEANNEQAALAISGALAPATAGSPVVLDLGPASRLEAGVYKLVSADGLAEGNVTVTDDYLQSVLREGLKGSLSVEDSTASFDVAEQTGFEMTWNTSGNTTNAGLVLTDINADPTQESTLDSYNSLKGVASINVDADRTLSLQGATPLNGESLVLNNLQGDKTLTVIGDGKEADFVTLASPEWTDAEGNPVRVSFEKGTLALSGVAATVQDTQQIGSLELTDSSFDANNSFSEIGQLSGNEGSTIGGLIRITGSPAAGAASPAAYNGSYGEATIILGTADKGAEQTLTPGKGLTLIAMPGSTAHLTQATKGKEMELLTTAGGSVVDLGEAAVGDTGLTLNKGGSIGGELAFSMAAGDAGKGIVAIAGNNATYDPSSSINITQTEAAGTMVMDSVPTAATGIVLAQVGAANNSTATVTLNGSLFHKYYDNARLSGNAVVVDRNMHYVSDTVKPDSHNGHAGASLLDDILVTLNPQANPAGHPDLAALMDAVDSGLIRDTDAAAVAGASIAALGNAFSGDVERQLRAIRNRTTTMGVDQCQVNENMPYFNAWVNAEGDYRKLEQDGTAAGYTLSSWGGTVGFDIDLTPSFTAGLAVTAMYGDLDSAAPDRAEGDFDTYYVSLFARYASRSWTHTFVGSLGWLDASLDRTVSYPGGSYKTNGDTKGLGFGLMYEVGYVIPLNEDSTACLQPVFNVAWRHVGVDGYSETGDAGLRADDQSMDVVTFGLGARFQSAVAENIYNRTALFEARALLKADAGDRQSDLNVGLLHGSRTANIESAEVGAVGVELGAGLTIPVGAEGGALFIDGSAELRDGYTNLNGTVGYRINF